MRYLIDQQRRLIPSPNNVVSLGQLALAADLARLRR
jgi:hypothetical protein